MVDSFAHLHVHTEYSILDGASKLDQLVQAAARDNQPGLAITDHGNMYGVLDFYKACHKEGVKPILGLEAYMALRDRYHRPKRRGKVDDGGGESESGGKLYYHLTLLAENNTGYQNLIKISSRAFLEGYYYKPRCDWEILADHHEGIIATSGCLGGQIPQALIHGNQTEAIRKAARFQEIFGRDNFFIEIQDHGIPEQIQTNPQLLDIARQLNAPVIATNDSHYTDKEHAEAHDALLCVQTGAKLSDPDRFRFHGSEHYLKTAAEMHQQFGDIDGACTNTLWIVERSNVDIKFGDIQLPDFPIPPPYTSDQEYLEALTLQGAQERWGATIPDHVLQRLAYELEVIRHMGFASYFLVTWDIINYANSKGIRVGPGRGSAAGCAVAYALRITNLDPIKYDLLFERFLNPGRMSMPDIDMDFDSRHRDELIRYSADKYGHDKVAQIVTFGRIKARAAVRDAARVLGYPHYLGDKIAKAMPKLVMGRDTPLKYCLNDIEGHHSQYVAAAALRKAIAEEPKAPEVIRVAEGLEGLTRNDSIHAAAVVISREPLMELMPIQRKPESGQPSGGSPLVTQYEMYGVESLGLLKLDFLGLRNLDVISDCLALIQKTNNVELDIDTIPLDDSKTFDILKVADTVGVFQLEGDQMRGLIKELVPTTFEDVCALVALYRPGPMAANMHHDYANRKNGRADVTYPHPDAKEILADTYGLMIYQENVMRMAQKFANYSLAEADTLRKAMGKKIRSVMAAESERFVSGVEKNGYTKELGEQLFHIIQQFADYAFNKSHSYGYGLIAYQTAYLKANYPVQYFSALLSSVKGKLDSAAKYLNECRLHDVKVMVPDVNTSEIDFTPIPNSESVDSPGCITYGLSSVRNVGVAFVTPMIEERNLNGPYLSFNDFIERVDLEHLNKRTIESMIKAGAFDSLGHPRKGLLEVAGNIVDMTIRRRREQESGAMSLFALDTSVDSFDDRPEIPNIEFARMVKLAEEKEMLGLYVSDHPLSGFERTIKSKSTTTVTELLAGDHPEWRQKHKIGGVITNLKRNYTRKGDLMCSFWLVDQENALEVLVFPKVMHDYAEMITEDAVVIVSGKLDEKEDSSRLFLDGVEIVEEIIPEYPLQIVLASQHHTTHHLDAIKRIITNHPGNTPVQILLNTRRMCALAPDFNIDVTDESKSALEELLGVGTATLKIR